MGIINRTLDSTEQKIEKSVTAQAPVNTTEIVVGIVERAMTLTDAKTTLLGISGAPTIMLRGFRFVAGTGGITFNIGSTLAVTAYGTSGYQSISLPATGSTLLNLQKGDLITAIQGGGTGAASTHTLVEIVAQNIQDIKTWF